MEQFNRDLGEKLKEAVKEKKAELNPDYKGNNPQTHEEVIKDLGEMGVLKKDEEKTDDKKPAKFFTEEQGKKFLADIKEGTEKGILKNWPTEGVLKNKDKTEQSKIVKSGNVKFEYKNAIDKQIKELGDKLKTAEKNIDRVKRNKGTKEQIEERQKRVEFFKKEIDKAKAAKDIIKKDEIKEQEKKIKFELDKKLEKKSEILDKTQKSDKINNMEKMPSWEQPDLFPLEKPNAPADKKDEQKNGITLEEDLRESHDVSESTPVEYEKTDEEIEKESKKSERLEKEGKEIKEEKIENKKSDQERAAEMEKEIQKETKTTKESGESVKSLREKLIETRKEFALADPKNSEYNKIKENYKSQTDTYKQFLYELKKSTLEKKGLKPEEIDKELEKYIKEIIAPHFAVVEAANIQNIKSEAELSTLKMMKDSKWANKIYDTFNWYRKLHWSKKILFSGGLFAGGIGATALGGGVGLAFTGAFSLGKLAQIMMGGGAAAVGISFALENSIKKEQEKLLGKAGWGENKYKDKHEFVAFEIKKIKEKAREAEKLKKEGKETEWMIDVEKQLKEREALERKFERNRFIRTAIGSGLVGAAVGSGAAWQAIKQYGEWTGASEYLGKGLESVKKAFGFGKPNISGEIVPKTAMTPSQDAVDQYLKESGIAQKTAHGTEAIIGTKPPLEFTTDAAEKAGSAVLEIGKRGSEGAIIDYFKTHLEAAGKLGLLDADGKINLLKTGNFVHLKFLEDMNEAFSKPETLEMLKKFGFPQNKDGYLEMMKRIGKGFVEVDPNTGKINLVDMEYLKALKKAAISKVSEAIYGPQGFNSEEALKKAAGLQRELEDYINDTRYGFKAGYYGAEVPPGLEGESLEAIAPKDEIIPGVPTEQIIDTAKLSAIGVGITPEEMKGVFKVEGLQKFIDSTDGKMGGILSKLGINAEKFVDGLNKTFTISGRNKIDQLMDMDAYDLYQHAIKQHNGALISFVKRIGELSGYEYSGAESLKGHAVGEVINHIDSSKIFGGTAQELIDKNM